MAAELHELLARDHERLDALLASCVRAGDSVDAHTYDTFRRGLLRHIAIEEGVLFPALRKRFGLTALEAQLHRDHAALAALLVPPASPDVIETIRRVLVAHNPLEEGAQGLYELVEIAAGDGLSALMDAISRVPEVRVAPHRDSPLVRKTIEQLLRDRSSSAS
jgi:hypothetical protein